MSGLSGRAAALAVATLRERTGLVAAHAAQLLTIAEGSVDNALELFTLDPNMFNVSQHSLLPDNALAVGSPLQLGDVNDHGPAVPSAAASIGAPLAVEPTTASESCAPLRAAVSAAASHVTHTRSPAAIARRRLLRKEKRQLRRSANGVSFSFARREQIERAAFQRGVMAEKANAKQRRGARQAVKKVDKQRRRAEQRMGRRRRAAQD